MSGAAARQRRRGASAVLSTLIVGSTLLGTSLVGTTLAGGAPAASDPPAASQGPTLIESTSSRTTIRYDAEYPTIGYTDTPSRNAIARLEQRIKRGEVRLKFEPPRGYLDSVLEALGIDPSSQTLVYSKTSLQFDLISSAKPRAIYFDDDTYVAWIPGTAFLEIATMDAALGPVFYTLSNVSPDEVRVDREISRCLTCHDTWGMTGGGVPKLLFLTTLVDSKGESFNGQPGEDTTDRTPIRDRWGGWYVTGRHGKQEHLGNIFMNADSIETDVDSMRRGNLDSTRSLFDASSYKTDKSDIVALLIFEHQAHVGNLMTRVNFKSRTVLQRNGIDASTVTGWAALPANVQRPVKSMLEPLVEAMMFVKAAEITSEIRSSSGFDRWFESKGPRDAAGRSLRDFDLRTRLFRHPLSYLVYSESFNGLPAYAKDYVYTRFADVVSGRDQSPSYSHISAEERVVLRDILLATKPDFAAAYKRRSAECARGGCAT